MVSMIIIIGVIKWANRVSRPYDTATIMQWINTLVIRANWQDENWVLDLQRTKYQVLKTGPAL